MPVYKPSQRYCYAYRQRPYWSTAENRLTHTWPVLVELSRADWREIEAMQGPLLDRYDRTDARDAHEWVKAGRQHETGLWTDRDDRGRQVIRYAEGEPPEEAA